MALPPPPPAPRAASDGTWLDGAPDVRRRRDLLVQGLATGESGEELGRYIVIEVDLPRN